MHTTQTNATLNLCIAMLLSLNPMNIMSGLMQSLDYKDVSLLRKLMPCPFTASKMFCAGPNFLSQPKNLTEFSASLKTFVPAQKTILLNSNHLFVCHKMFVTAAIGK